MNRCAVILLCLSLSLGMLAAAPAWEEVDSPAVTAVERIDAEGIELTVRDGYVYVTVAVRTEVRIFSILGQLISRAELAPGTSRFKLPAKGIYVFKAGSSTRRITA